MRRIFLSVFVILMVFVVAVPFLAAADITNSMNFNLYFEKKPTVLIDFVSATDPSTTIDSISFPLVTSANRTSPLTAKATIRFLLGYASDLYIVCTRVPNLSGYIDAIAGGSGVEAGMLLSDDGTRRLNYKVAPTLTYTYDGGTKNSFTPQEEWSIDPSTWVQGKELNDNDEHYSTATVLTQYRMAKVYTNDPAYLIGDQLIYNGAYTDDIYMDVEFTVTPPEGGITDGIYTGYCHLVLIAK